MWLGAAATAALTVALLSVRPAHAAIHHAALVIQHSSGSLITRCVAFAEEQITGLQLIERSGMQYEAQDFGSIGSAICQLDREPSTVPPGCFGSGPYWQYFHRQGGGWQNSALGASSSTLHDGDMDGWHFTPGAKQAPGNVAFAAVCAPPPAPTVTPVATATYQPTPAHTATPPGETASIATPSPGTQALAPSVSPPAATALAATEPPTRPPPGSLGPWLLLGGAVVVLTGLGAFNLWRRRS